MKHRHKLTTILLGSLALSCAASHAQLKTGSNPATLTANTNLEVEATNGKKLLLNKADGTLTYQHVTQGDGKVLTSDANGVATWQNPITATIINAVSTSSPSSGSPLLNISSTTPGPFDLMWKIDLTPGIWQITYKGIIGALGTGKSNNFIDIGLIDSSDKWVVTFDLAGAFGGKVHEVANTRIINISTAGTYRFAARWYTSASVPFKGYFGFGISAEIDASTGSNWFALPDFAEIEVPYYLPVTDHGIPQAVKLK